MWRVKRYRFNLGKYHGRTITFHLFSLYLKIELIYYKKSFNVKMEFGDWRE